MTDETLEQPTSDQETKQDAVLQSIAELSKKFDGVEIQLQAIREGLVLNSVRFDRLEAKILNINANLTELTEEIRRESRRTPV